MRGQVLRPLPAAIGGNRAADRPSSAKRTLSSTELARTTRRNLELVGADRLEEAREAAAELRPEVEEDEEAES